MDINGGSHFIWVVYKLGFTMENPMNVMEIHRKSIENP